MLVEFQEFWVEAFWLKVLGFGVYSFLEFSQKFSWALRHLLAGRSVCSLFSCRIQLGLVGVRVSGTGGNVARAHLFLLRLIWSSALSRGVGVRAQLLWFPDQDDSLAQLVCLS